MILFDRNHYFIAPWYCTELWDRVNSFSSTYSFCHQVLSSHLEDINGPFQGRYAKLNNSCKAKEFHTSLLKYVRNVGQRIGCHVQSCHEVLWILRDSWHTMHYCLQSSWALHYAMQPNGIIHQALVHQPSGRSTINKTNQKQT